jgi:HEAT repeat protein
VVQSPEDAAAPQPPAQGAPGGGPYRNLWVPLVVVPFLVVGVIVLVFVFFGAIRGKDPTLQENLERVVSGGANERKQAAMSLAVQVVENRTAELAGRPPVWPVEGDILVDLQRAWEALPEDDNPRMRLTVAELGAHFGDPAALDRLLGFLEVPDADDPRGELRVPAMIAIAGLGDERAAVPLAAFLTHEDPFLRQSAAAALQAIPGETSRAALVGLLDDTSLELRGQAAISLARHGDPAGAGVLRELIGLESYAAARAADARKFATERSVHDARLEAVRALARLGRVEDRELFQALAESEGDPAVREAAMLALQGRLAPAEPPAAPGEAARPPER